MPAHVACELLESYFTEPGASAFECASPFVLTSILRKKSVLDSTHPRPTSTALLCAILWCTAQAADVTSLYLPGARSKLCRALYELCVSHLQDADLDYRNSSSRMFPSTPRPSIHSDKVQEATTSMGKLLSSNGPRTAHVHGTKTVSQLCRSSTQSSH